MAKVVLTVITSGYGTVAALNDNFQKIALAVENTLSRDGTTPNDMSANIDMGGYKVTNLGEPTAATDAVRLSDLQAASVVTDTPTQTGHAGQVLKTDGTVLSWVSIQAQLGSDLSAAADKLPYFTSASAMSLADITAYGRTLVALADHAALVAELSLGALSNLDTVGTAQIDDGAVTSAKLASNVGVFTTGDVKFTLKSTPDSGWVVMNDGSIGDASSAATTRANADTQTLFELIWNNVADAWAPVSGGRGASASADFAAHKRLTLPKALGRALAAAGAGASLTSRALGETLGEESHTLTGAESGTPVHGHPGSTGSASTTIYRGSHDGSGTDGESFATTGTSNVDTLGESSVALKSAVASTSVSVSVANSSAANASQAHNNMQPSLFLNVHVKL